MPGSPPAAKCPTSLLSPLLSLACPWGEHLWDSRLPCWGGGRVCVPPSRPTFSLLTSTGTHLALPGEDRVLGTLLPPHVGGHRPNWQAQSNDEVCARRCPPGGPPTGGWRRAGAAEDGAAGHQPRLPVSAMPGPPSRVMSVPVTCSIAQGSKPLLLLMGTLWTGAYGHLYLPNKRSSFLGLLKQKAKLISMECSRGPGGRLLVSFCPGEPCPPTHMPAPLHLSLPARPVPALAVDLLGAFHLCPTEGRPRAQLCFLREGVANSACL